MMHMNVMKKIGKQPYSFTFMGENLHEVVMESQHLGFSDVAKCGLCGSDDLELRAYTTEVDNYEYVKINCRKCRANLTLGKTKKDGAFFLRREEGSSELAWKKHIEKRGSSEGPEEGS